MSDTPVVAPSTAKRPYAAYVKSCRVTAPGLSPASTLHTSASWLTARWPQSPDARATRDIPGRRRARASASGPAVQQTRPFGCDALTEAECRVLRYLPTHLTAREIADELYVSRNTVRTHMRHIYAKLGASRRSDAVDAARAAGLLRPPQLVRSRIPEPGRRTARRACTAIPLAEAA